MDYSSDKPQKFTANLITMADTSNPNLIIRHVKKGLIQAQAIELAKHT